MQKANDELWESLEEREGRGGGETGAAFWHPITSVSSCKALHDCLRGFSTFLLSVAAVSVRKRRKE